MITIKNEKNLEFVKLIFWSVEEAVEYAEKFHHDFLIHELEIIQTEEFSFNTGKAETLYKKEKI